MKTLTKDSLIALIIVVLLAAAGAWYWQMNNGAIPGMPASSAPTTVNTTTSPVFSYSAADPLVIHHTTSAAPATKGIKIGKINTYSGVVPSFSTCDQLSVSMSPTTTGSSHFTLLITDTNAGTCPVASASTVPFTTGVALKSATTTPAIDSVVVNGIPVPFALVEGK